MILHVCSENEWLSWADASDYAPHNFADEAFIHACNHEQLKGVLQRYFSRAKNLLVLHIDETKLTARLKYEESTNSELFPHIYGRINKEAIIKIERID